MGPVWNWCDSPLFQPFLRNVFHAVLFISFNKISDLLWKVLSLIILISAATCYLPAHVEKAQVLEAHLEEYSDNPQHLALHWASQCNFGHPDPDEHPHYSGTGQNVALISGFKPSLTKGVCGWKNGSRSYSYFGDSCSGNCDPSKQMVWATSKEVECAMWQCNDLRHGWSNPQYLVVCQYRPGGNYPNEKPYRYGEICRDCKKGYLCFRSQCIMNPDCYKINPVLHVYDTKDMSMPKCVLA
ncbi:GLIPR1-like protein 1 [Taenia solium]|eukprot:TsM_000328700 transcript=TsM_000328700 gene=TsM_000328700